MCPTRYCDNKCKALPCFDKRKTDLDTLTAKRKSTKQRATGFCQSRKSWNHWLFRLNGDLVVHVTNADAAPRSHAERGNEGNGKGFLG